jgi:hypothetical protein
VLDPTGTGTVSKARLMDTMDRLDIICTDEHMIDELFERIDGDGRWSVVGVDVCGAALAGGLRLAVSAVSGER